MKTYLEELLNVIGVQNDTSEIEIHTDLGNGQSHLFKKYKNHYHRKGLMDYLAGTLELIGLTLIRYKNKWAFLFGLLCNLLWISYAILYQTTYGLLICCIPLAFLNISNFFKWRKDDI